MAGETGDIQARLLVPVASYVRDRYGVPALNTALAAGQLTSDLLATKGLWISLEQFGQVLEGARAFMKDDHEFVEACAYQMRRSIGPLLVLLYATSFESLCKITARTFHLVSRVSRFRILEARPSYMRVEYEGSKPETRLMCLSRQSWFTKIQTLAGLPEATLQEESCMARGDKVCRHVVRWQARMRWKTLLVGLGLGIWGAFLFAAAGPSALALALKLTLPALGLSLALAFELRRAYRINIRTQDETSEALREVIEQATQAQAEVLALSRRQESWAQLMEEQIAERTERLQEVVSRLGRLRTQRALDIRGVSHDLRNPLTVLRVNCRFLHEERPSEAEAQETLADMSLAVDQIDGLLKKLMESATSEAGLTTYTATTLRVADMADSLRRRLRALVMGKEIRITVLTTREAPETIESDALLFDRVVDNLLTNAAKYTDAGSIVVEVGGVPGMFCLKISDTGRGIGDEHIEEIFTGQGKASERAPQSYGVGLAGVVRLLAGVGGRLEILSKPQVGTTFWAYFPLSLRAGAGPARSIPEESLHELVDKVVTIRRSNSA
jgi:signal transduction histidine kinase